MMKLLKFNFVDVDGSGNDVNILVGVDSTMWECTSITKNQIDDAIASYVDSIEDWQYEELIEDVLKSFDLDFEFVDVTTFTI